MCVPMGNLGGHGLPGAGRLLLQAQGDLFLLVVDVQDLDFDFLVDGDHLGGMADAAPTHVGDVQQAVDAAQVDEGAELGDVLDHALAAVADFQLGQELGLLFRPFGLDQGPAADDDVAAGLVDLQHQRLNGPSDVVADVGRAADVDLAGGQEHRHADIDQQPALDLAGGHAGDDVALMDRIHDRHPGLDLLGLALAEGDHAAGVIDQAEGVLDVLDEDLDHFPRLGQLFAFFPLVAEDNAFALIADVDQDHVALDPQDAPLDDLIDGDFLGSPLQFFRRHRFQGFGEFLLPFLLRKV